MIIKIHACRRKYNSYVGNFCICVLLVVFLIFWHRTSVHSAALIMTKSEEQVFPSKNSQHDYSNNKGSPGAEKLLKYISLNVRLQYLVVSNVGQQLHEIRLENTAKQSIPAGNEIGWSIYFNDVHIPEYEGLKYSKSFEVDFPHFMLSHVDGGLFKLTPTRSFEGIESNDFVTITLSSHVTPSRYYVLPRWYVAAPGQDPWIIQNTDADQSTFVPEFNTTKQWKRSGADHAIPFTLKKRFEEYFVADMERAPLRVIPKPVISELTKDKVVLIRPREWSVSHQPALFKNEIKLLADMFKISLTTKAGPCPPSHIIEFTKGNIEGVEGSDEAYKIVINSKDNKICITAQDKPGAFYAVQSLLSLAKIGDGGITLPAGLIKDSPRFGYRGLHVDVSRNFIQLKDMLQLIEAMAMYKLNKLHLHLTDDEGWRIEIPGLPELTEIGAVRRHSQKENDAIFPALGSGPFSTTSGTGFYSVSDYQKILKVASVNHIHVIPEIDVPGHSHAAIRAMEARHRHLMSEGRAAEAEEFLLSDPKDRSSAMSVQHFVNNAINPCMESTYKFMSHVVGELKRAHKPIQPLTVMHVGGDEVARNSWAASPICKELINPSKFPRNNNDLQEYFMRRMSKMCKSDYDVTMAVWEDGALKMPGNLPYDKSQLNDCDVIAYAWNNDWNKATADRAYKLANAGYKVVMAHATHLYFDHPQEPDPDENGLSWATRYIDDKKVFDYRPDDLYGNAKIDRNGFLYSEYEMDEIRFSRPEIEQPQNIIGMQANLWTELVRDATMMHSQLFPRLIAFAERAWHKAEWELDNSRELRLLRSKDWMEFANTVGYKELPRLKEKGIHYRIPPPGVSFIDGEIHLCSLYPGFTYFFRPITEGSTSDWSECRSSDRIPDENAKYEFLTSDGARRSRAVKDC